MEIVPGNIVILKNPWKPSEESYSYELCLRIGYLLSKSDNTNFQRDAYRDWEGFTHGLILYSEIQSKTRKWVFEAMIYDPFNMLVYCSEESEEIIRVTLQSDQIETVLESENMLQRPAIGYIVD